MRVTPTGGQQDRLDALVTATRQLRLLLRYAEWLLPTGHCPQAYSR